MNRAFRLFILVALATTGVAIALVMAPFALAWSPESSEVAGWFSQVVGTGEVISQPRPVAPFHRVVATGSTDIEVSVGGSQSVVVEAQRNIADIIETSVEDGTLTVASHGSYSTRKRTLVRVVVPALDAVSVRGSSDAVLEGVRGALLDVSIRGSGDVTASGSIDRLIFDCAGSGDGRLRRLAARDAVVRVRGSGDAQLSVSNTLDVEVSGSGDVTYVGSPRILHQSIRGSGSLNQA